MKRIYHTFDKWECFPAGLYENQPPDGIPSKDAPDRYAAFLRDTPAFEAALSRVVSEWKNSCEHYLTNENMNRIAWLGQASACIALGLPAVFRGGFNRLSEDEQRIANETALKWLNVWLEQNGHPSLTMEEAASKSEANRY